MKKSSEITLCFFLVLGDIVAIILSFFFAYYIRTHIDPRPYFFDSELLNFTLTAVGLIPIWLIVLAVLGLYKKNIYLGRSRLPELGRIFMASLIGIMTIITYDFFKDGGDLFPVRVVALYTVILCFLFLIFFRTLIRFAARQIFKQNHGTLRALIIGDHRNTEYLASYIYAFPESGYRLAGIITNNKHASDIKAKRYSSLEDAIHKSHPDVIFQTDDQDTETVYCSAINHHLLYYFVPSETELSSHLGELELIGSTPVMLVKTTPLIGIMAVIKRLFDIIFSFVAILIAIIPMGIIWLISKLSDPTHSPLYADYRLSQYNRQFKMYKFRSMKSEYSGMTAEEAFTKMGHPEYIKKYRKNGDYMKNDPRITKLGHFLRRTSLDELPQLFNILKGDISLIGPRALLPNELENYGDRSLILSVKSGLTGLAQVSGRRDIPFEERRAIDIYYVKNWSLLLDLQILLKTIAVVFTHKGAK